jgi:uncharacterized protein
MLFAVLFEDDDNCAADVRSRHMSAHLDFLSRHASMIRAAGPLRQNEGSGAGGLWLVEAETAYSTTKRPAFPRQGDH